MVLNRGDEGIKTVLPAEAHAKVALHSPPEYLHPQSLHSNAGGGVTALLLQVLTMPLS